jgi:hypothetical protein
MKTVARIRSLTLALVLSAISLGTAFGQSAPAPYKPQAQNGVWLPADGSAANLTFTNPPGAAFFRIGTGQVQAFASISYPTNSDSHAAQIAGLPVTVSNSASMNQCVVTFSGLGSTLFLKPNINTQTASFYNGSGSTVSNATLSGQTMSFICFYQSGFPALNPAL